MISVEHPTCRAPDLVGQGSHRAVDRRHIPADTLFVCHSIPTIRQFPDSPGISSLRKVDGSNNYVCRTAADGASASSRTRILARLRPAVRSHRAARWPVGGRRAPPEPAAVRVLPCHISAASRSSLRRCRPPVCGRLAGAAIHPHLRRRHRNPHAGGRIPARRIGHTAHHFSRGPEQRRATGRPGPGQRRQRGPGTISTAD